MTIASVVVATEVGAMEAVRAGLAGLPGTEVYGARGNEIITVLEADSLADLTCGMERLAALPQVVGVYPVYAGNDE